MMKEKTRINNAILFCETPGFPGVSSWMSGFTSILLTLCQAWTIITIEIRYHLGNSMKEKRQTIQKGLVWEAVTTAANHPNAEQIYENIVLKHPSISRATVYRNLNMLVDEGKVKRIRMLGGPDHFDRTLGNHYHIQCTSCKQVSDIEVFGDIDFSTKNVETFGYVLESYEIVFNGICPDCQKKHAAQRQ
ncbi:Fur family transcriptional regulator [Sphaerochaeta sp. UBA5836]|uniref:Fur family transcriptional regulator n=2 Tax=unclassified Sphaerochaeta TaxID=2637943 RepID=UPI0025DE7332|nr:transcriptional repressor [Sphaerochaeta sp. UBA5836]